MNYLSYTFIIISVICSCLFAFFVSPLMLAPVFCLAAGALEITKYGLIRQIRALNDKTKFAAAALIGLLSCFSGYATYSALDQAIHLNNIQAQNQSQKYEAASRDFRVKQEQFEVQLQEARKQVENKEHLESLIRIEETRADRNAVTDRRIAQMKSELKPVQFPVAPEAPEAPVTKTVSDSIAFLFAGLIESAALLTNFLVGRSRKETLPVVSETPTVPVVPETIDAPKKVVKVKPKAVRKTVAVQESKPVSRTKSVSYKKRNDVKNTLELTPSQRVTLATYCKKHSIDWKTFNLDLNNVNKAKQILGI